jgi:polyhydroxybutyrate depolymerase
MEQASMSRALPLALVLACLGAPPAFLLVSGTASYLDHRSSGTVAVGGEEHDYIVHVPASYDGSRAVPLVMSLHGAASWPSFQQDVTGWNDIADRHGFIVAYPGGRGTVLKTFGLRDVEFIAALIDKLQASFNIDRSRIYANGLSNGGGMSDVLSCVLSDRLAAIGAVGAALTMTVDLCKSAPPMPMVAFHGTSDPLTRYEGGKVFVAAEPFPDIPGWLSKWARRNQCESPASESRVAADVTRFAYDSCAAPIIFYRIEGGGHTWPGGPQMPEWFLGPTNRSINATELMWSFFREHSLK